MTPQDFDVIAIKLTDDDNKTNLSILTLSDMDTAHDDMTFQLGQCSSLKTIRLENFLKITSEDTIQAATCAKPILKNCLSIIALKYRGQSKSLLWKNYQKENSCK